MNKSGATSLVITIVSVIVVVSVLYSFYWTPYPERGGGKPLELIASESDGSVL